MGPDGRSTEWSHPSWTPAWPTWCWCRRWPTAPWRCSPSAPAEVTLRALESIDLTRRLYEVTFNQVAAQPLSLSDADAVHRYERAMDVVRTLVAAEQVGGAARSLELLVDYTGDRVQFDRPIASFQVVKHDAADLLADVTSARAALAEAIRRIVIRDDQAGHYAALAKAVAGRAFLVGG